MGDLERPGSKTRLWESELEEVSIFESAYELAKEYKLESEFMLYFIRGIREGRSVLDAVLYAKNEWDL